MTHALKSSFAALAALAIIAAIWPPVLSVSSSPALLIAPALA